MIIEIKPINKSLTKWKVIDCYGTVLMVTKDLLQALDFVMSKRYKLN